MSDFHWYEDSTSSGGRFRLLPRPSSHGGPVLSLATVYRTLAGWDYHVYVPPEALGSAPDVEGAKRLAEEALGLPPCPSSPVPARQG